MTAIMSMLPKEKMFMNALLQIRRKTLPRHSAL